MYTLNQLADGRVELCLMKPTAVAVFYSHALATMVADRLNEDIRGPLLPGLGAATEMALAEAMPDLADVDTPRSGVPEAEIGNENAVVIESDAEAYEAASRKIAGAAEPLAAPPEPAGASPCAPADDRNKKQCGPVEQARFDELVAQGMGGNAIANEMGWARSGIFARLKVLRAQQSAARDGQPLAKVPLAEVPAAVIGQAQAAASRPLWWREIDANLNALGYRDGWTERLDFELVEGLALGKALAVVADEIGKEMGQAKARFVALIPDGVTIEKQTQLLQVLRVRAEAA